ncbi:two component transcriptional regulator, LytTR family [Desulfotomaculum arcticum]|uniref:Stage 0 sporulation protein A homolog n=1 Tax=Desulfotruncus arcticus DSM 17038 TaxID=1121424 RepID=A0A1I2PPK4_9FIRM|nr:LytTR family DNA-binding domain-containing protein [Desulfotruncus arcticus]SFG15371.1 two component transcriptional regulator, LytTR family [Desulfotomaculum arcticum] [Desulfotruncus arcticus DSM 17038]
MIPVKVIATDDEAGVLLLLHSILSELDDIQLVGTAENAVDTLRLVKERDPDLALLDIELPDMKGIELAEKIQKLKPDLYIVFITAHQEYSLEAYQLYAYDYILKPIDKDRVKNTVRRIQKAVQAPEKLLTKYASGLKKARIAINSSYERVFLKLNDIYYLEKQGRHTLVHYINGQFTTRETLQNFEQRLGTKFFRSHKSYIINIEQVERVINLQGSSYYEVKFKNNTGKALLSRDRVNTLLGLLES